MAYATNEFCWHGCISTDTERSKAYYAEVLGFNIEVASMGGQPATFFGAGGQTFAHLASPPLEGVPSHWNSYFRVEDVDATAQKAASNGGKVLVPGTDIPPGRFAVVASPSGATFSLFHESMTDAKNHPGGPGSVHWVELHSHNLEADKAWLAATFGLSFDTMPMPTGDYTLLKHGDEMIGGAMPAMDPQAPSMWLTWFHVTNVDEALARATQHGGKGLAPIMEAEGVGRMAIVQDPTGAVFGIITPPAQ